MKILVKSAAFQAFASYSEKLCLSVAERMPDFKLKDYFVVSQSVMKMIELVRVRMSECRSE